MIKLVVIILNIEMHLEIIMNGVIRMNNGVIFSLVVPLYNKEHVIGESYNKLTSIMDSTKERHEIVFVNDGSENTNRDN